MFKSTRTASKVTYNVMDHLLADDICNHITKENHSSLIKSLMDLCMDHNKGIIQQKAMLLRAIIRNKFSSSSVMKSFPDKEMIKKITYPGDASTDCRIYSEVPVIHAYLEKFGFSINNLHLTFDTIKTNFFKQAQANPDCLISLIEKYGLKKNTYQDVKSGLKMIKNSSRGSIGILTYDENKKIIPFTTLDLDLEKRNMDTIKALKCSFENDLIIEEFRATIDHASKIMKSSNDIFQRHEDLQSLLWENVQRHSAFTRSVSFIFPVHTTITEETTKFVEYKKTFLSLLKDKTYDLTKIQDRKEIFKAMLVAKKSIDQETLKKINYLVHEAHIQFDPTFLQSVAEIIKKNL